MLKVLTAAQMREVDRLTTEEYGMPSILLMENAANAVARVISQKLGGSVKDERFTILCGTGNNGGDGAALARILWTLGANCFVYLAGKIDEAKGDARENFETLLKMSESDDMNGINENCLYLIEMDLAVIGDYVVQWRDQRADYFIDALFGTGLSRPVKGVYADLIKPLTYQWRRNLRVKKVFSIDLPSGLSSDSSDLPDINVHADVTVTFTAPKLANVRPPAYIANGELIVANIGSPPGLVDEQSSETYLSEKRDVTHWLNKTEFANDSYKNKRGHALLIAGSDNYSGAAVLCGNAAIRSGVGLVTIVTPQSSRDSVSSRVLPEVMVRGVAGTVTGSISEDAFDEIGDILDKADSIAIGSGLSLDESTGRFVRKVIKSRRQPVVVDADALNLISPFTGPATDGPPLILTPHEGEFMRLLGETDKDVINDRVAVVRDFSVKHKVIVVLKGERVLIGGPGGKVVVNPTGNSGLGKAGNGDTLTGILTGFIAQAIQMNVDIFETVVAAVFVAGMAGDIAEKKYGKRVMTASDVRECLAEVFGSISGK